MLLLSLWPTTHPLCHRSLTADQCASVVGVLCRGDFECRRPVSTGKSACPAEIHKGFEPNHRSCRSHCPSKSNFTLEVHQHVLYFRTTVWVPEENVYICMNRTFSGFIFTCEPITLINPVTWQTISKQLKDYFYLTDMGNTVPALAINFVSTMMESSFCSYLSLPAFLSTLASLFWGLWVEFILP